jgi:hypothetical protein
MFAFLRADPAAVRAGKLLGHVLGALMRGHGLLDLLEQGLGFRQRQPKGLRPQRLAFQLGNFLHHVGFTGLRLDNDLYLQPHRKVPL